LKEAGRVHDRCIPSVQGPAQKKDEIGTRSKLKIGKTQIECN